MDITLDLGLKLATLGIVRLGATYVALMRFRSWLLSASAGMFVAAAPSMALVSVMLALAQMTQAALQMLFLAILVELVTLFSSSMLLSLEERKKRKFQRGRQGSKQLPPKRKSKPRNKHRRR